MSLDPARPWLGSCDRCAQLRAMPEGCPPEQFWSCVYCGGAASIAGRIRPLLPGHPEMQEVFVAAWILGGYPAVLQVLDAVRVEVET